MAYPPFAEIETNYTAFQQGQGDNSFPGSQMDVDLANLKEAFDDLNAFVRGVTRSDGQVGNQTIGVEQLKSGLKIGNFAAADVMELASIDALLSLTIPGLEDGQLAHVREYHPGTGSGGGFLYWDALSVATADNGLIFGTGTGRWVRIESAPNGPLHLAWWGLGKDADGDIAAVEGAFKKLFMTETNTLYCDGLPVRPDRQILLNEANINIGGALTNRDKFVFGLNIRPVAGTWGPGDSAFYIHGSEADGLLQSVIFSHCHFDGGNTLADYAFKIGGYYHVTLSDCAIQDCVVAPFYDTDANGVSHGLVLKDCDIRVSTLLGAGTTGIILENFDVIIRGGWTSWVETSIFSSVGGFKVDGHHFVTTDGPWGIHCTAPTNVHVANCDFDGAGILFDDTADPKPWFKIQIIGNEFGHPLVVEDMIEFRTGTPDNFVTGLTIIGNPTITVAGITPAHHFIGFTTEGAGSWSSDWEAVFHHSEGSVMPMGDFPAKMRIAPNFPRDAYFTVAGGMVVRNQNAFDPQIAFENNENAGTDMPSIAAGGTDCRELFLRNGDADEVGIDTAGHFKPGVDNAQTCGTTSRRWSRGHFVGLTLNLVNAADDTAAAAAGVPLSGLYRTGSDVKVRVA